MSDTPFICSVLHPSDFSEGSHDAFRHALAIAVYYQAAFTLLHMVAPDRAVDVWTDAPHVRTTLERWGLLAPGSDGTDIWRRLALQVQKINVRGTDIEAAIQAWLETSPADLLVLASADREGGAFGGRRSRAERIARHTGVMTLFVPAGCTGFVSEDTGTMTFQRIVVALGDVPDVQPILLRAASVALMSRSASVDLILLRDADASPITHADLPPLTSCTWTVRSSTGDRVEQIRRAAEETGAGLILTGLDTEGGIVEALRGSFTERVRRVAPCPVLAVPHRRA